MWRVYLAPTKNRKSYRAAGLQEKKAHVPHMAGIFARIFKQWFEQSQGSRKVPKGEELYEAITKKFGSPNIKDGKWHGITFVQPEEEEDDL